MRLRVKIWLPLRIMVLEVLGGRVSILAVVM